MDISRDNQGQKVIRSLSTFVVEGYAWLMAVTFGITLLDIIYARMLLATSPAVDPGLVFSEVSDLLLWIGGISFLVGIAAIGASWRIASARNFVAAGLLVVVGGAMIPLAIFLLFPNSALATMPGAGWWIRLSISGAASSLAFLGLRTFHQR